MAEPSLKLRGALVLACLTFTGCFESKRPLHYLGDDDVSYYKSQATALEFPDVRQESPDEVISTGQPRTLTDRTQDEVWDLPLSESIFIALQNNRIVRTDGSFLSPGNSLLASPDRTPSIYDPAIQESGVLFGGRGVEAALAAFDAQWNSSLFWGRDESFVNNLFAGSGNSPGASNVAELANFDTSLTKTFGYGGQLAFLHNVDYLGTNSPAVLFPSAYSGSVAAQYRQPLLAGAGTEFTRIAGPIGQSFGGITGVNQGVVIARINNDITLADFEASVLNLLLDVERVYWELYLSYVRYDTALKARNSAQRTWRDIKTTLEVLNDDASRTDPTDDTIRQVAMQNQLQAQRGVEIRPSDEAQARDAYYQARTAVERALAEIYSNEARFRRLLGLPVNDGRIIRPLDAPSLAEYTPDWSNSLAEALTHRVELRKQKWNIKSLELQLKAANSLTKPRLDFVSQYRVNGLGDDLIGDSKDDGVTSSGLDNMYGTLTRHNQTGWGVGVEMSVPLGFRSANAQVRNVELRLSKAREVLATQEMEISHEVGNAIQELALHYQNTQTLYNRRIAADTLVEVKRIELAGDEATPDELIRAIASQAEAEAAYFESLVRYNQALVTFQYRKGTLLAFNHVHLAEGDWDPEAYDDALRRARERTHGIDNPFVAPEPAAFANPHHVGEIWLDSDSEDADRVPVPEAPEAPPSEVPAPQAPAAAPPADDADTAYRQFRRTLQLTPPPTPNFDRSFRKADPATNYARREADGPVQAHREVPLGERDVLLPARSLSTPSPERASPQTPSQSRQAVQLLPLSADDLSADPESAPAPEWSEIPNTAPAAESETRAAPTTPVAPPKSTAPSRPETQQLYE